MTTISLMLMAIYYKLKFDLPEQDINIEENDDYKNILNSIRKKLVKKIKATTSKVPVGGFKSGGFNCFLRVQPSSQFSNLDDYKFILSELELIDELPYPKTRRFGQTYRYLRCSYF